MAITTTAVARQTYDGETIHAGDRVDCLLTVTNGGSDSVNVTDVAISASGPGYTVSKPFLAQGATVVVVGSGGTLKIPFSVVAHAPLTTAPATLEAASTISIATQTYTNDGQCVADDGGAYFVVAPLTWNAGGGG